MKAEEAFRPLLSNASVFGRDLYTEPEVLSELCRLTDAMFAGPGAVRAAIDA